MFWNKKNLKIIIIKKKYHVNLNYVSKFNKAIISIANITIKHGFCGNGSEQKIYLYLKVYDWYLNVN